MKYYYILFVVAVWSKVLINGLVTDVLKSAQSVEESSLSTVLSDTSTNDKNSVIYMSFTQRIADLYISNFESPEQRAFMLAISNCYRLLDESEISIKSIEVENDDTSIWRRARRSLTSNNDIDNLLITYIITLSMSESPKDSPSTFYDYLGDLIQSQLQSGKFSKDFRNLAMELGALGYADSLLDESYLTRNGYRTRSCELTDCNVTTIWNSLNVNGDFESDFSTVAINNGTLFDILPKGWIRSSGTALITYQKLPKINKPTSNTNMEFLSLSKYDGYMTQTIQSEQGASIKLILSLLSFCTTPTCTPSTLTITIADTILLSELSTELLNIWETKAITFIAPTDLFNLTLSVTAKDSSFSGILIDDINIITARPHPHGPGGHAAADVPSITPLPKYRFNPSPFILPKKEKPTSRPTHSPVLIYSKAKPLPPPSEMKNTPTMEPSTISSVKSIKILNGQFDITSLIYSENREVQRCYSFNSTSYIYAFHLPEAGNTSTSCLPSNTSWTYGDIVQQSKEDGHSYYYGYYQSHSWQLLYTIGAYGSSSPPKPYLAVTFSGGNPTTNCPSGVTTVLSFMCGANKRLTYSFSIDLPSLCSYDLVVTGSEICNIVYSTFKPSKQPTVKPTSRPTISLIPKGCVLPVLLLDSWGDGWNEAKLTASRIVGLRSSLGYEYTTKTTVNLWPLVTGTSGKDKNSYLYVQPGRTSTLQVITKRDSDSSTINTREYWEILWQAVIGTDVITGNADSSVSVYCEQIGIRDYSLSVEQSENLISPADKTCNQCETVSPPKPSPPTGSETVTAPLDAPKPKPKPKSFPLNLYDSSGYGWFNGSFFSTDYIISDEKRLKIISSGSLCDVTNAGLCTSTLVDGSYVLRVGGNLDERQNGYSWKFCGIEGTAKSELVFTISKGKCDPGQLLTVADYVAMNPQSHRKRLVLKGSLLLVNIVDELSGGGESLESLSSSSTGSPIVHALMDSMQSSDLEGQHIEVRTESSRILDSGTCEYFFTAWLSSSTSSTSSTSSLAVNDIKSYEDIDASYAKMRDNLAYAIEHSTVFLETLNNHIIGDNALQLDMSTFQITSRSNVHILSMVLEMEEVPVVVSAAEEAGGKSPLEYTIGQQDATESLDYHIRHSATGNTLLQSDFTIIGVSIGIAAISLVLLVSVIGIIIFMKKRKERRRLTIPVDEDEENGDDDEENNMDIEGHSEHNTDSDFDMNSIYNDTLFPYDSSSSTSNTLELLAK